MDKKLYAEIEEFIKQLLKEAHYGLGSDGETEAFALLKKIKKTVKDE